MPASLCGCFRTVRSGPAQGCTRRCVKVGLCLLSLWSSLHWFGGGIKYPGPHEVRATLGVADPAHRLQHMQKCVSSMITRVLQRCRCTCPSSHTLLPPSRLDPIPATLALPLHSTAPSPPPKMQLDPIRKHASYTGMKAKLSHSRERVYETMTGPQQLLLRALDTCVGATAKRATHADPSPGVD